MGSGLNNSFSPATLAVHGDDHVNRSTDVAPALHVSTTFRYANDPQKLVPARLEDDPEDWVYSRVAAPNTSRLEAILSSLMGAKVLTYSSGLAAFHALLVYFRPNKIAISEGYHGCHGVVGLHTKLHGLKKVDLHDESTWDAADVGQGDVVHLETPLNPTGEAYSIAALAEKAHRRGAILSVDATLGPPGLQDPFAHGADVVMHSGTKYVGGHSDMLCGVLAVRNEQWYRDLFGERIFLGSIMGSLEGWLGVRSVRTLELRIQTQSRNTEKLVSWLYVQLNNQRSDGGSLVSRLVLKIQHASLQTDDMDWLKKQMPNGFGPVFALWMKTPQLAMTLPSKLKFFHHATSLGGVESLIEWRRMSDANVDERLLRVSVGVESWEDLRADLWNAFTALDVETDR